MARKRKGSSQRWLQRQAADPYVQAAQRRGLRSRAVFKLEELDRREQLFRPGMRCVDLGAAPGGWSEYAAGRVGPRGHVWALDLLPMAPVTGVTVLEGDFGDPQVSGRLQAEIGGSGADLVMSDLAPNISGNRSLDQARAMALAELAFEFARKVLRPGGDFVIKLFQGEGFEEFLTALRPHFGRLRVRKPEASRQASREVYLIAKNYRI